MESVGAEDGVLAVLALVRAEAVVRAQLRQRGVLVPRSPEGAVPV
jgi:hypothetical protein